ncbi:hypothetical protein [Streptomyces sp. QH1-20]|uniref:HD domain-containing protein n=1 Tax=Streptomyces sp. QH1-20 TaxID=3240934 RepID=UPI0035149F9C
MSITGGSVLGRSAPPGDAGLLHWATVAAVRGGRMRQDGTCNGVWGSTVGALIQAGTVNFHGCPDGLAPAPAGPWVESATDSTVWQHVPAGRNADFFRQHVAEAVATLARWREAAESGTTADPWRDDGFVPCFAEAVEWLLGEPDPGRPLDLYPAEAALLVLMPFLHRVQCLRLTASLAPVVEPGRLGRITGAPPLRTAFEVFSEGHDLLVERGRRRPEAAEPIGWWLFHRWLAQREEFSDPVVVQQLLRAIGPSAEALGETLDPRRVCRLLHGPRRGPGVCDREYLDSLPADDSARIRRGGQQRIRDQRIGLLLALAHGMSRGITALPRIVVEHVGIPFPVDLAQLRQTLDSSGWGGSHDLPVLRAECRHEAVIEGLREYTAHADELLAAVRRTAHERVTQPMPRLPARLSADEVMPSEGAFTGWAAFRLDERRVRDLLMGIQLYKDRDLAVRELYQNALDACRYRRARTQYLDRTREASYAYAGRIDFEQGTDEDGREYVECRDNGVELREGFHIAGVVRAADRLANVVVDCLLLCPRMVPLASAHVLASGDHIDEDAEERQSDHEDEPPCLGPSAEGVVAEYVCDDPEEQEDPQDPHEDPYCGPESAQDRVVVGQIHVGVHVLSPPVVSPDVVPACPSRGPYASPV